MCVRVCSFFARPRTLFFHTKKGLRFSGFPELLQYIRDESNEVGGRGEHDQDDFVRSERELVLLRNILQENPVLKKHGRKGSGY